MGRLILLGATVGAVYALRSYLKDSSAGARQGDVQMVLDNGATVEPDSAAAQEFVDVARKILEIGRETS